jgi:hypothetical protein
MSMSFPPYFSDSLLGGWTPVAGSWGVPAGTGTTAAASVARSEGPTGRPGVAAALGAPGSPLVAVAGPAPQRRAAALDALFTQGG